MDEQREQQGEGQRPAPETTGEVADEELQQASGGFSFGESQAGTRRLAESGDGKLLGNLLTA